MALPMLFRESASLRPQYPHRTAIVNTPHTQLKLPLLPLNPELAPLVRFSSLGEASVEQGNCLSLWVCYQGSLLSRLVTAVLWETLICAPLTVPLHQKQGTAKEQSLLVFGKKGGSENWEAVGTKMSDWGSEWGRDSKHRGAVSGERSLNYRQIGKWWRRKEREKWGWGSPPHQRPNKLRFNAAATSWGTEQNGWKAHKLSSWMSTALMLAPPPATCMMCKGQFFNLFVPPSPHL